MIGRIVRKELTEMWRDGRFRVSAAIILSLVTVALVGGWRHAARVAAEHDEARQATRAQWLNQPEKNPHSAAHYGVYAFRPQTPLAAVDTGVDPYVGVAAWLEAHRQNEARFRPAADRAAVQRFGDLTAAFVMQTLVPLVIVLLGFAAVAGEREQGTLRQLASLGVDPRALVAGKALGVAAALAAVLVPAAVLGALAVSWANVTEIWDSDAARTTLLALVYTAWGLLWIGLTIVVSIVARAPRTALVSLLAIWMATTLVAPRVVSEIAARVYPTPTAAGFQAALDTDLADRAVVTAALDERRRALLAEHGVATQADLPINFAGISFQAGEEHANDVFDAHFGRLYDTFDRQNRLTQTVGLLAPALAVRSLSMSLAGSDFAQHRHFSTAAEEYRRDMQRVLNDDIVRHPPPPGQAYLAGRELWERIPDFDYRAPGAGWVLARQGPAIAALFVWLAIVTAAVTLVARRAGAHV